MPAATHHDCYAVTAPGLEALTALELRALGAKVGPGDPGGLPFRADTALLYAANLHLRTASRVLVRVAEFRATAFRDLEKLARSVPWERFVVPGRRVQLRVTCRKSRLYHSDAVAERVLGAIGHRLGGPVAGVSAPAREAREEREEDVSSEGDDRQLFVVRLLHDRCTISADSSGANLHLRGYRQAVGRAPLRETLAAAMLLGSGWDPETPLVDPLCGSGTIAIEGALLARRIPPGLRRRFAFEQWPEHDRELWRELHAAAEAEVRPAAPAPILASDRDAGAVTAAAANAARAGVSTDVTIEQRALSDVELPAAATGWLLANPPYGHRVGDTVQLRDLYARIGQVARTLAPGWTVGLLTADGRLEGQVGLPFEEAFRTTNGGLRVRFAVATVER